jgi:FkbM family methyltransferase
VLPLGIDPLWDMQRLATRRGLEVRRIFDIGAHVGLMSREFLDAFPAAEVDAFEPHPNSFACLAEIGDARLRPHRLALSDRCGEAEFFVYSLPDDPDAPAAASMNNSLVAETQFGLVTGRYTQSIRVDCATVDQVCQDERIDRVDILKIDTEGHEVAVLDGAQETLAARGVQLVFLEFETLNPIEGATGGALAPAAERLEPLGFRFVASYPIHLIDKPLYAAFNALFLAAPR